MGISQDLYTKAKKIIPGGTQLLSKRPEMFLPELWPSYYSRSKGCEVWDLEDKKYIDMSYMGIGACILGYADDDVDSKVIEAVKSGNMTTLNVPEEVELANLLCDIHPWADMVRYARTGGEAMVVAVRIARAATKKDKVLFCGYHGWHDWYLSSNLASDSSLDGHLIPGLKPLGVPRALAGTSFPFEYNNIDQFLNVLETNKDDVGVIVLEAVRNIDPDPEFLKIVREKATENNIVLIIDEISSGFRLNVGGAHLLLGIEPDIAVFAKGMSNGYPMSAIIGKREFMDAAQDSFISSTYWTDKIGPTAALASIKKMQKFNVPKILNKNGEKIQKAWKSLALKNNLNVHVGSIFPLSHFDFEHKESIKLKTLFTQLMLDEGYLATNSYYASYAHTNDVVIKYLETCDKVFKLISEIISNNKIEESLVGPVCQTGFKRLS